MTFEDWFIGVNIFEDINDDKGWFVSMIDHKNQCTITDKNGNDHHLTLDKSTTVGMLKSSNKKKYVELQELYPEELI